MVAPKRYDQDDLPESPEKPRDLQTELKKVVSRGRLPPKPRLQAYVQPYASTMPTLPGRPASVEPMVPAFFMNKKPLISQVTETTPELILDIKDCEQPKLSEAQDQRPAQFRNIELALMNLRKVDEVDRSKEEASKR